MYSFAYLIVILFKTVFPFEDKLSFLWYCKAGALSKKNINKNNYMNNSEKRCKDNNSRTTRRNLLKQNYLSPKTNHAICFDGATLHKAQGIHLLYGMDLPSRNIICHCFTDQPINVSIITETLTKAFNDRSF